MIAKLTGILDSVRVDSLILDVNGVGYLVFASRKTLENIGVVGDVISLLIETHVREDHIHLYGFASEGEQEWFGILTKVQGVGVRVGMAILSALSIEEILTAIAAGDKAMISRADGVGPKLAVRILTELKDKVGKFAEPISVAKADGGGGVAMAGAGAEGNGSLTNDAVSALVNLGYGRAEAFTAVMKAIAAVEDDADMNVIIPLALKELSS